MACIFPIRLYRDTGGRNPVSGKWPLSPNGFIDQPVDVPCGKCVHCRLEYSRQWAIRGMHELHYSKHSCFLTLTYNDENLPWGGTHPTLVPIDLQLFIKRLRKDSGIYGIRYLACGEYGPTTSRPHYHLCLFGIEFNDVVSVKRKDGSIRSTSATLSKLWTYGDHDIGTVTFESIAYVARYIMDKQMGPERENYYNERGIQPEFLRMSRGSKKLGTGGLGLKFFQEFHSDIFPADTMIIRGGIKTRPPKYYSSKFELINPIQMLSVKNSRKKFMIKNAHKNTLHQLRISEIVTNSRIKNLTRKKI